MHGGLFSNDDVTLEDIKNVDRNRQPPDSGMLIKLFPSLIVITQNISPLVKN